MTNKDLKKRRMLSYFIRSAQNIIKEDGISGVTLRKVAQGAGYNVATLYNYFEDLDQLVLFACLKYLQIYNQALNEHLTDCNSAKEKFYLSWRIFCEISFENPEAFHQIFFNKHSNTLPQICERYYEVFPEERTDATSHLYPILSGYDLNTRNTLVLKPYVEEEHLPTGNLQLMNELCVAAYHQLLNNCLIQLETHTAYSIPDYVERMLDYLKFIILHSPAENV